MTSPPADRVAADTPAHATDHAAAAVFPGVSDMAARCRTLDWAATPLGPVAAWPESLRTAAGLVMDSAFATILCWGPELVQVYNDGYVPITGIKHPWALGRPTSEVWPEVWHLNQPLFARAQAGETVHVVEAPYALRRRGPDQPPDDCFFTLSFSPVRDGAGAVAGVVVTAFEVTDQVAGRAAQADRAQLLAEVAAERAQLRAIVDQAPAFMAVLRGPHHRFEHANAQYQRLVGGRAPVGVPVAEALPEVVAQGFIGLLDRVLATGEPFVGREVPIDLARAPGGAPERRYVDFVYQAMTEADGTRSGVFVHGVDVTDAVAALQAAEQARERATEANRAKSTFLATMSHELRTPLNAIGGYAELIALGVRGPVTAEQRTDLEKIQRAQRHLLGLINGVLNYAKVDAGAVQYAVEVVPLDEVLATCEALVAPQVRAKGLTLRHDAFDRTLVARADREKVQQVVLNLLSNAVKFTEPGGRVTLASAADGAAVRVTVRDTGIGIAADQLARVFEPFVQVDARLTRTQEGTGLGLAISRDLARGMGGDLTAESAPGVGSTFTLTLPGATP